MSRDREGAIQPCRSTSPRALRPRRDGRRLAGAPAIWPTAILNEGDSLAFDILAVASPDPGSYLTVVIQT